MCGEGGESATEPHLIIDGGVVGLSHRSTRGRTGRAPGTALLAGLPLPSGTAADLGGRTALLAGVPLPSGTAADLGGDGVPRRAPRTRAGHRPVTDYSVGSARRSKKVCSTTVVRVDTLARLRISRMSFSSAVGDATRTNST
jgi:hypothetical protein